MGTSIIQCTRFGSEGQISKRQKGSSINLMKWWVTPPNLWQKSHISKFVWPIPHSENCQETKYNVKGKGRIRPHALTHCPLRTHHVSLLLKTLGHIQNFIKLFQVCRFYLYRIWFDTSFRRYIIFFKVKGTYVIVFFYSDKTIRLKDDTYLSLMKFYACFQCVLSFGWTISHSE